MQYSIRLPWIFFVFWFFEGPKEIVLFFASLNKAFFQLFSLPLLLRTFFRPIKNEYREGLVGFSIGMGMCIKSVIIIIDIMLFSLLFVGEVLFFVGFLFLPIGTFLLLFSTL